VRTAGMGQPAGDDLSFGFVCTFHNILLR
jgi:hypothetical protein